MRNRYQLTVKSGNAKTGPISVTISTADNCPDACPLKSGCYAQSWPLRHHWQAITTGRRRQGAAHGTGLKEHCKQIAGLPRPGMIRLNQAGDLPGDGRNLYKGDLSYIADACKGLTAFTYTHYRGKRNIDVVKRINAAGNLTVNLSANSPADADKLAGQGSPVASIVPTADKVQYTPAGKRIVLCPAQSGSMDCKSCGNGRPLCARKDRDYIIGFYPHGAGKSKALETVKLAG